MTRRAAQRFKPYPDYKDSGLDWLGEIPGHWTVRRLKYLALLNAESLPENTDPAREMVYVDIGNVDGLGRVLEHEHLTFAAAPSRARRLVRDGDVIVSTVRTYLRAIAALPDPDPNMVVSTGFAVVRPTKELTTGFAAYALRAPYFVERVVANSKGVSFPAINESEMSNFELAAPPQHEQRAIAAFLDRETAKIDALVAKKERLIELLQEKRAALIARAVTKGLDPTVPMKDSGADWLGEVPAHWEVRRLSQVVSGIMDFRGRTPAKLGMDWGGEIPALSAINVRDGNIDLERGTNYGSDALHDRWMTQGPTLKRDVLFTTEAPLGNTALIPDSRRYILSQRVVLLRPQRSSLDGHYLQRFLSCSAFRRGVEGMSTGSTAEGIKRRHLIAMCAILPPIEEQRRIAAVVDEETVRADALVSRISDAIERLKEIRTALISAAVSGKIDVQGEVA